MAKCMCGEFYSEDADNCPGCGAENYVKSLREAKREAKTVQAAKKVAFLTRDLSPQAWKAKMKRIYGIRDEEFKSINERWSKEKCMEGLKKFRLGQIALKKVVNSSYDTDS